MIEAPPGDSFDVVEENGVLHLFESGLWRLSEEALPDEATEELETIAVSLWNTCGIILRDESEFITNKKRIPRGEYTTCSAERSDD